uniref:5-hydroxytryptamine (serotonin) receptor 3A n=1 Tax=Hucho hucho TaxID=62062 RepID=A0A4W5KJZ7_9TELE
MGSSYPCLSYHLSFLYLCQCDLTCKEGHSGPTYESMQTVFDRISFRPAVNLSNPTIANISFTLYAVLGVVSVGQCKDAMFLFNEKTQILTTFLWLRLVNQCPYVYVNHTGHIRWDRMLRLVSACNLEIFSFPFDVQNCSFTFGSYMHTTLSFEEMSWNSKQYLEASGEWELVNIYGEASVLKFGIDEWDIITFWVVIKRRPVLYVVNLLIPSSFLMLIDILSFYLPPHSVDRASFKMTLILGYTVFLLIMNDLLPSTANGTPLIGIYFSVCLALMVISLLETVIITNVLHSNSKKYREVPHWVRVVILKHIAPSTLNTSLFLGPGGVSSVPELRQICQDLSDLRAHLTSMQKEGVLQEQWCHVGYVLDFLLFRIYLLLISCYAMVIISMWCIWINQ